MLAAALIVPGQHDHVPITFAFDLGPNSVRILVIAGALLVTAAAFVRPFVTMGRQAQITVTTAAGLVVMFLLLIAEGLDMPQQAVVALLGAVAVPFGVAWHFEGLSSSFAKLLRPVAPWVVGAAGVVAAVELVRAGLLIGDPDGALRLVHTSIGVGLVGLSWLVLCRPGRRPATNVGGWVVGNVVLAGVAVVAIGGIA